MKIEKGRLQEDFGRDIYWGQIYFFSDDEQRKSRVLTYSSFEYLRQLFKKQSFDKADFSSWLDEIIKKWSALGEDIFNQDVHYDIYATTPEGERKGLEYLMEKL